MRPLPFLILLGFPILELFTTVRLAREVGWWLGAWLIFAALAGTMLIREAGKDFPARLAQALRNGDPLFSSLVDTGRTLIAGLLLIFPGVLSDIVAIVILLVPFPAPLVSSAFPLDRHSRNPKI